MKLINKSHLKKIQRLADEYKWLLKLNDNELSQQVLETNEVQNALSELLRFANEVINLPDEAKQMNLATFRETYGIPEDTATRFVYTKNFPAYKQGSRWYVDIDEYKKWRETEHRNSYRFA